MARVMPQFEVDCPWDGHGRVIFDLSAAQAGDGEGVHSFDGQVPCSAHGNDDGLVVRLKLTNNRGSIAMESIERG